MSDTTISLCLTGMDYAKKDTLFDQAKSSLRKYAAEECLGQFSNKGEAAQKGDLFPVKSEVNTAQTEEEEVYGAWGGPPFGRGRTNGRGMSAGGGAPFGRGRPYNRGMPAGPRFRPPPPRPRREEEKKFLYNRRYANGEYMRCYVCDSITHLSGDCPDNPRGKQTGGDNASKVYHSAVLKTGNDDVLKN